MNHLLFGNNLERLREAKFFPDASVDLNRSGVSAERRKTLEIKAATPVLQRSQIMKTFFRTAGMALLLLISFSANAADKILLHIGNATISIYRTADLESAKAEAKAAHKPIAWVASAPTVLNGKGTIALENGRGATLHAFFALRDKAILIFEDALAENHKVLPLVDDALHTPDPHYTPPTVIFLDADAKQVLAKVTYEPDFVKRAHALADALEKIQGKF